MTINNALLFVEIEDSKLSAFSRLLRSVEKPVFLIMNPSKLSCYLARKIILRLCCNIAIDIILSDFCLFVLNAVKCKFFYFELWQA